MIPESWLGNETTATQELVVRSHSWLTEIRPAIGALAGSPAPRKPFVTVLKTLFSLYVMLALCLL